jgi:hypothetical protein
MYQQPAKNNAAARRISKNPLEKSLKGFNKFSSSSIKTAQREY